MVKKEILKTIESTLLDSYTFYTLRVKNVQNLSLDLIKDKFSNYSHYMFSMEGKGKGRHIHGCVGFLSSEDMGAEDIRLAIKEVWPDAVGNKCLSVSEIRKRESFFKYMLKEGDYVYKGFTQSYVKTMEKLSFKKDSMGKDISDNEEKLINKDITFEEFVARYLELHVIYGKDIYDIRVKAYSNRFMLKADLISYKDYATSYIIK